MSTLHPTRTAGDKTQKALTTFCELLEKHPDNARQSLLLQVATQYDLSPKECEFLNRNFKAPCHTP